MTLAEFATHLGVTPRQIRFMIAEEILPSANKTGRSADAYGEEHALSAQRYLAFYRLGMKPASIKVLMAFDDAVPIIQSPLGSRQRVPLNILARTHLKWG